MRKTPISKQVSPSEMREMRLRGMTNKQIAESLDISPATVYRYIGKKSHDVEWTSMQKKPTVTFPAAVVGAVVEEVADAHESVPEAVEMKIVKPETEVPGLELIREVRILDLKGALCTYHVDQRTGDVEMGGDKEQSIVYGMISGDMLDRFIEELNEIKK